MEIIYQAERSMEEVMTSKNWLELLFSMNTWGQEICARNKVFKSIEKEISSDEVLSSLWQGNVAESSLAETSSSSPNLEQFPSFL